MPINRVLLVISLVLFILAGLGVGPLDNQIAWGLAALAGSMLS